MESSGFFNAEEISNGQFDREYFAEQFAYYFSRFIGNGIYTKDMRNLQVVQEVSGGMYIVIHAGDAFINGYWYHNNVDLTLQVQNANAVLPRIDSVMLQWNITTRDIKAIVKQGVPANNPVPPNIQRDSSIWELELARVSVKQAQTGITDVDIQDMRLNAESCGIVHGVVDQVDMTTLFNQFTAWFNQFQNNSSVEFNSWFDTIAGVLTEEAATNLYVMLANLKRDVRVGTGEFTTDAPYTAVVEVPGLKTTDAISVYLAPFHPEDDTDERGIGHLMKIRRKLLGMIDEVYGQQDGILVFKAYSKRPTPLWLWLRGASAPSARLAVQSQVPKVKTEVNKT